MVASVACVSQDTMEPIARELVPLGAKTARVIKKQGIVRRQIAYGVSTITKKLA